MDPFLSIFQAYILNHFIIKSFPFLNCVYIMLHEHVGAGSPSVTVDCKNLLIIEGSLWGIPRHCFSGEICSDGPLYQPAQAGPRNCAFQPGGLYPSKEFLEAQPLRIWFHCSFGPDSCIFLCYFSCLAPSSAWTLPLLFPNVFLWSSHFDQSWDEYQVHKNHDQMYLCLSRATS